MKKFYSFLAAAALVVSFSACGGGADDSTTQETKEEEVNTMMDKLESEGSEEQLAEHACSDKCTAEQHHYKHGEKGHTCSEECGTHEHAEGEEHNH
jgi:hypothetical protein